METDFDALYEFHAVDQTLDDEFCKSTELQKLYTRRRSISLTSEVDPEVISAIVARVRSKREPSKLPPETEVDEGDVVKRRNPPKRNTSDPKRPSSMLVHDNEELLQLADELHLRDMAGLENEDWKLGSKSKYGRRSSTYAGILLYQPVSDDQNAESSEAKNRTLTQKDIEALRRISVCSSRPSAADGVPLKLSPKSPSSNKLSTLTHLFGSGSKRGGGSGAGPHAGGVQSKIAKKMERQLSRDNGPPVTGVDSRREQFVQSRSNTVLNLFGNRRRSIAVSDDAYSVSLRSAKSHLDLAQSNGGVDPEKSPGEEKRKNGSAPSNQKTSLQRKFGRKILIENCL